MDQNSEIINHFESLLKTRTTKKTPALYTSTKHQNNTLNSSVNQKTLSAREVLTNVSKQLKAIQNADTATYKRVSSKLDNYKNREFLPIEMIPVYKEVPKNLTKFETQCVTDTQLINVIESAEIVDKHRGVTQEFDETFCQKSDGDDCDNRLNDGSSKTDKITDAAIDRSENNALVDKKEDLIECNDSNDQDSKLFENSGLRTCDMDAVTCYENDMIADLNIEVNINASQETQGFNQCVMILDDSKVIEERSTSPILNASKRNSTPPLVVSLYSFEEFENLAHPIIEEQEDLEMAKKLINSQILGREIYLPDHIYESFHRASPVLNKIECITTNINKDDFENLDTHSDSNIDINITCNQSDNSSSEKKELKSKILKAEIEDEILFSSDEEYEYLHKDIQELPLTCALETSFYDKSDVLDKTMYVGFQTASNKSIQIQTDSFTKAKRILSSIDSEKTETTLKDLVEIFDSGKAVNENVQNTASSDYKPEYETENKYLYKIELENNKDTSVEVSENHGKVEEKICDTFKNVSLTALEQEGNVNDDIVMSQVITCKSTPRSTKVNNNVIYEETKSNIFNAALTQNKHMDDDIIMSQVIKFKSIPRTPKSVNTTENDIFKKPKEQNTKRKFEGFKTASNKKIKLSDKALDRCKKIFQDIYLNETECLSGQPNLTFSGSTSSKIEPIYEQGENNMEHNLSTFCSDSNKTVIEINSSQPKKELNSKSVKAEIQLKIEDVDLQISDKVILKEFEENDTPFEEIYNNNVNVGFKTASNKNIVISNTAITKTKKLIQEIMNIDTENYIVNESTAKCTDDIGKTKIIFKKPVIDIKNLRSKETDNEAFANSKTGNQGAIPLGIIGNNLKNYDLCQPPKSDFIGFKTGANKEIKISDKAIEKTKDFYKDLDKQAPKNISNEVKNTVNMEKKYENHIEDEFNCGLDTQDFLAEELTHIDDLFKYEKAPNLIFQGFQTASKKPVVISKKALEKGRHIFEDISNKQDDLIKVAYIQQDSNSNNKHRPKTSKNDFPKEQEIGNTPIEMAVKEVDQISEINLEDKIVFVPKSDSKDVSSEDPTFIETKTVSKKPLNISAALIENTNRIFTGFELKDNEIMVDHNNGQTIDPKPSTSTFVGFQTASNKKIQISAKALANSKQILNDFQFKDDVGEPRNNTTNIFTNKSLGHHETNNFDIKTDNITPSTSTLIGFQRASNKKNKMPNEAMAKGKNILQKHISENDMFETKEKQAILFKDFKTASNKEVSISEKTLEKSKRLVQDIDTGTDLIDENHEGAFVFKRFQTASNKKVEISEKALAKSKKLFEDMKLSQIDKDYTTYNEESAPFKGLKNANNRKIEISEKVLANSEQLFQDINVSQHNQDCKMNYPCEPLVFQTSSNKKEEISVDKVHTANIHECAPVFKGFQTASNKKVEISEKALAKSKKLFEDLSLSQVDNGDAKPLKGSNIFNGFQTACNNKVEVSEQALAGSKKLFQGFDLSQFDKESEQKYLEGSSIFKGFQTASNKNVELSEQALAKSKKLFEDLNLSQLDKDPESKHLEGSPIFKGFQTASNKKVEISEKALVKSKKLFEDLSLGEIDKGPKTNPHESSPIFKGFQTASKKIVEISEKALVKSKKIFDDLTLSQVDKNRMINNHESTPVFKGFETASNKKVYISEKALAKSKNIFKDLSELGKDPKTTKDLSGFPVAEVNNDVICQVQKPVVDFKGFQTGSNKIVKVSSLAKTKNIFKDIHQEIGIKTPERNIKNHSNVVSRVSNKSIKTGNVLPLGSSSESANDLFKDVIDTQVLNDFQDTQNTEDFCKSTPKSKRSGSPILSCPRAKKRKFKTPYRSKKKVEPKTTFVPPKVSKTFNFNPDYKKHKKYCLKDLEKLEREYTKIETDPYIAEFKFDTLLNFQFFNSRNDYTEGKITVEELKKILLDSVNKKIVPDGWLDNHIKLILWKLLSYEIKYPNVMKNTCSVRNVLEQLKYRYDRELYHVQRPILRKVLEKDEVASKTMVLCVAEIYVDNISGTSVSPTSQNMELLLTDGWYCVRATTDRMLVRLAANGSIVVGTKIAVCGAELINCEQGIAPWEDTSSVRLKLSGNSVRRVRWSAQLGVRTDTVRCPLRAARADGGRVAALRAVLTRVYPPLYVEKMDDGSTVTLSERLENIRQTKYESERQAVMEKLYEEVEKEMSDQDSQDSEGCSNERVGLESGSQISKCMKRSKDLDEYRSHLTKSQNRMLEEHSAKQRERLIERVRVKFQQKLDKTGLKMDRNVIPLLKVRIAGLVEKDGVEVTKGYLSIWRPSAAVLELLTEGAWIEILNVIPTGIRNSEIQLSAGRQTVFNPYKQTNDKFKEYSNTLKRKCYKIEELTHNPSMNTDYNETDTVGMVICIEPSTKEFNEKQNFQNVYLADANKNIVCVNFWGGLKKFGFENVLDTGQIVTCVNLQKRAGNTRKSIPEYRATEFSYFTKTPKDKKALEITNELSNKLSKIKDKFCEDCIVLKNNYSVFKTRNNEGISPYTNNIVKMVSPVRNDVNLNLTGLDFDSSFDTQDISPQVLLRKKRINEKIEKIRLYYGEPPPLSAIHIVNQSKNASATYKSPLILNSDRPNATSIQNTGLIESPVSLNRTYVKNINPVKLNFSNASLNDVDHFAEEFDASPPLSLDSDILN